MRDLVVLGGSSHPALTAAICERLAINAGKVHLHKFSNLETNVTIFESVRGLDVFIVQSGCGRVNDQLMELLIMIYACRMASARKITVVLPLFPYSRQPDAPFRRNGAPLARLSGEACTKLIAMGAAFVTGNIGGNNQILPPINLHHFSGVGFGSCISRTPSPRSEILIHTAPISGNNSSSHSPADYGRGDSPAVASSLVAFSESNATAASGNNSCTNAAAGLGLVGKPYKVWTAKPGTLVAEMLVASGAQHIITLDLHHPQYQGFFNIPVDNLLAHPLMCKCITERIPDWQNAVIVSPDAGGAKRASAIADTLEMSLALIHKDRRYSSSSITLVGSVTNRDCIIVDDLTDTCHTITRAASVLHHYKAARIYAVVTHGIFSGNAIERINNSYLDSIFVSNSVPQDEHLAASPKIKFFDVAPLLAEAIRRIHNGESVSFLFDIVPIVH